jgi:membrane protein insertase Oxa1/YidC/SpoIIIJ
MATMWLTQKMSTVPSADPKQQQMSNMMQWMMPLMFGFIFLSFPSGLALYIVVMNIFRMIVQYFVMGGWGGLATLFPAKAPVGTDTKGTKGWNPPPDKTAKEIKAAAKKANINTTTEEGIRDGSSRSKRKNRRRRH